MNAFFMALSFLTVTPWISSLKGTERDMARSLYFYPLVGLLLGAVLAGVYLGGEFLRLGTAGSAAVVSVWLVLTGGLHADGLMDASDGFFSGKERESCLEIMRDSRVGAMGVLSLAIVLLLKVTFLEALPSESAAAVLVLVPATARLAMVWAIVRYPYARETPGLGNCFGKKRSFFPFYFGLVFCLAVSYCLAGAAVSLLLVLSLVLAGIVSALTSHHLRGHTGDTYGFLCEFTEMAALIIIASGWGVIRVL